MPNIFLQHPVHGAKIATSDLEAQHDMENGWYESDSEMSADEATEPQDVAVLNALEQPKRRARRVRQESAA